MKTRAMIAITVLAVLLFAATIALAESDGQATFGSQWWYLSTPEAKFQEYRDVPRGGLLESFLWRNWGANDVATLWGRNLLQHDQDFGLNFSKGVTWRADARFQSIPHRFSNVARTPYTEVSPGVFRLPDSLQRVNQEFPGTLIPNMQSWLSAVPVVNLATQTELSQVRLRSRPARGWRVELRGSERQRDGHQAYGATFGTSNAVELALPISQRLRDADAIASYERGRTRLQLSGGVSDFHDNISTLIWDNPRRYTDGGTNATGGSQGRMALAPDNQVVRGTMALGVRLPRASTLSAIAAVSRGTQNERFIPYTINTALPQSRIDSLPARSLNAKALTFTEDYRLSGRPISSVWTTLRFREEQYTNQTDPLVFHGFSATDYTFTSDTTEQDLLSWSRSTLGADVDFDLPRWGGVSLLLERQRRTHNDREVLADHENVFGGSLRLHPIDAVNLSGNVRHGERRQNDFDPSGYEGDPSSLRRFDVANRDQDVAQAMLTWGVTRRIDFGSNYTFTDNDYPGSHIGLLSTRLQQVTLDGGVTLTSTLDATGGWGYDVSDSRQHGFDSNSKDWFAHLHDRTSFVYLRSTWWPSPKRISVTGDYTYTWNLVSYDLTGFDKFSAADTTAGNRNGTPAQDPPDTFYRLQQFVIEGRWHGKGNTDFAARYGYDQYDVRDFSVTGVLPLLGITTTRTGTSFTNAATALFLGDDLRPYHAQRFALLVNRRF